ncbi:hypothetical protein [Amycolatopsis alkalitolerans]|uniref:hypothetical protein n=1 Tax=Amycolatopsis alkalitolerans TaxID=2547244 RepID=UPI00190FB49A|nr:hypothetical protein [Amycolatopsis alkalitolerans]
MRTPGGEHDYEAGQAVYWAPGHVPVALADTEYVDFSPTTEFAEVIDHIRAQAG